MLELNAAKFMQLLEIFSTSEHLLGQTSGALPLDVIKVTADAADTTKAICDELDLKVSATSTEYMRSARTSQDLHSAFKHVKRVIHSELQSRHFYAPRAEFDKYFRKARLFGDEVWANFPSANDDIYEAGMCLALDRYTACVLHLMRVAEAGLAALATAVNVAQQTDWGAYLRKIDTALEASMQAAGKRTPDEQFYAEAASEINNVRRAYRNPTMHPDRSYSDERAEDIFISVRSLMRHLATRLHE